MKIENLTKLNVLSLNQNPLGIIQPFLRLKLRSLSLQETSLTSAEFPSSYEGALLQYVSLSNNKIRSIHADDFRFLRSSHLTKFHLDDAELLSIDANAFVPLSQLQALSLKNNHLKSCEFLATLPVLASIKLDNNAFISLPQQFSLRGNMKDYSFTSNNISAIDVSSPLNIWLTQNYTNRQISLEKNPIDCCLSQWFTQFIQTATHFVSDSATLQCYSPSNLAGKKLMELDVNRLNCGGSKPSDSWWTPFRIAVFCILTVIFVSATVGTFTWIFGRRCRRNRSDYQPIPGNVDRAYDDIDEAYAAIRSNSPTESIAPSEAPTRGTYQGIYANDGHTDHRDDISRRAAVPNDD